MQRIGFLKIVLTLASTSRGQSLEALTRVFFSTVTKKVEIPADRREIFQRYVEELQLHRRYKKQPETAEIQDLYLCDPNLPSRSGAITGDLAQRDYRHAVYVEIPTWAAQLQWLRWNNYTLTDRGRVLSLLGETIPRQLPASYENNPFSLNIAERYISLFSIIDVDGDLVAAMYRRLLSSESFNRTEAGIVALEALEELRGRLKNASEGRALQTRLRLDRAIIAARQQSPKGGLGPRESIATPRTEPLVDCAILQKLRPDSYAYTFTDWGRDFIQLLVSAPSPGEFIENGLTRAMCLATGQTGGSEPSLDFLAGAYRQLRSGLGYVSIRELVALGIARSLGTNSEVFEIRILEEMLKKAASLEGRRVRLALGRSGGLAQVRIDDRAFTHASGS